jgi:hypothetical protein
MPAAGFAPTAAQELRLHVPHIVARLDSRQFEVLVDVIQNIAMAPMPAVGCCLHTLSPELYRLCRLLCSENEVTS